MHTCPICANALPDGAVYCARCGWLDGVHSPSGSGAERYVAAAVSSAPVGQAPSGAGGWAPYPIMAPRKVNGLAIGAMCTSIGAIVFTLMCGVGILAAPVGAILGHVSLGQIKHRGDDGKGFALAGIIIGWALTALVAAGVALIVVVAASG